MHEINLVNHPREGVKLDTAGTDSKCRLDGPPGFRVKVTSRGPDPCHFSKVDGRGKRYKSMGDGRTVIFAGDVEEAIDTRTEFWTSGVTYLDFERTVAPTMPRSDNGGLERVVSA